MKCVECSCMCLQVNPDVAPPSSSSNPRITGGSEEDVVRPYENHMIFA